MSNRQRNKRMRAYKHTLIYVVGIPYSVTARLWPTESPCQRNLLEFVHNIQGVRQSELTYYVCRAASDLVP